MLKHVKVQLDEKLELKNEKRFSIPCLNSEGRNYPFLAFGLPRLFARVRVGMNRVP